MTQWVKETKIDFMGKREVSRPAGVPRPARRLRCAHRLSTAVRTNFGVDFTGGQQL
jgi:hypothetical protein